jgi:hypothetical protein
VLAVAAIIAVLAAVLAVVALVVVVAAVVVVVAVVVAAVAAALVGHLASLGKYSAVETMVQVATALAANSAQEMNFCVAVLEVVLLQSQVLLPG